MKNTIKKFALVMLATSLLASCAKNLQPGDPIPGVPSRFSDLKVSTSFTWATTKTVSVKVSGFEGDAPIRKSLVLSRKNMPGSYYRGNHLMSESFNVNLTIPTALDSLVVTYGSVSKTYAISGPEIEVNYVVNYPDVTE